MFYVICAFRLLTDRPTVVGKFSLLSVSGFSFLYIFSSGEGEISCEVRREFSNMLYF